MKKKARQMCEEQDFLSPNSDIVIASLKICSDLASFFDLEDKENYLKAKHRANIFQDLPSSDVQPFELFDKAKARALLKSEKCCKTDKAKKRYVLQKGNSVVITGHRGMGKSILVKRLVRDILDQEEQLFDAEYVFYMRFRDINLKEEQNFLQFLTNNSAFAENLNSTEVRYILSALEKSEDVCIIMESIDEICFSESDSDSSDDSDTSSDSSSDTDSDEDCSLYDTANAIKFVGHLLNGRILPKAKKILTAHPSYLDDDDKESAFIVKVLGLDENGQKQVCRICVEDSLRKEKILKHIHSNIDLKSFCYVPVICVLTILAFSKLSDSELEAMDTITKVFLQILKWFTKNANGKFPIKKLSSLAYKTWLDDDREEIYPQELQDSGITLEDMSVTLTSKTKLAILKGSSKSITYFVHSTLRYFFVALKMKFFMDAKDFNKNVYESLKTDNELVKIFLSGLSNKSNILSLGNFIGLSKQDLNSEADRKNSFSKMENLAIERIKTADSLPKLMQAGNMLFEMRSEKTTQKAAAELKEVTLSGNILLSLFPAFHYLLRNKKITSYVEIKEPKFVENGFHPFFKELSNTLQQQPSIKVSVALTQIGQSRIL